MTVRVDLRTTASLLGTVLKALAWPLGVLAAVALGYGESPVPFAVPLVPSLALGEFEAMGAATSTFLNIGPAFGLAGPYGSYEAFPVSTKLVMIVLMWIGRIEIVPVLVLFTTAFWRS